MLSRTAYTICGEKGSGGSKFFTAGPDSGKPFLNATLADRTGAVEAKMWDYSGPVGQADEGTVVKVRGAVTELEQVLEQDALLLRHAQLPGGLRRGTGAHHQMPQELAVYRHF